MMARTLLFLVFFPGQAAMPLAQEAPQVRKPAWIALLPQQPGRIYGLGLAAYAPTEGQALVQAASHARAEVLIRLRANVQADTFTRSQATVSRTLGGATAAHSEEAAGQNTRIQAQATEVSGLVVEATWADEAGRTAYALAYLDIPIAEREIRSRFTALRDDLARETTPPGAPRERLRRLGRLKGAQEELAKLDDLAALLSAGGGDEDLRGQVRAARLDLERRVEQLRASLTLSPGPGLRNAPQFGAILRNATLKAGLGWAETGGAFLLRLDYHAEGPRRAAETGLVVARGSLDLTLQDEAGTPCESLPIEAKGVGVTEFQAEQRLKEDFKARLEKAFTRWLERL